MLFRRARFISAYPKVKYTNGTNLAIYLSYFRFQLIAAHELHRSTKWTQIQSIKIGTQ